MQRQDDNSRGTIAPAQDELRGKDVKIAITDLGQLPTLPAVAVQALAMANAPETRMKDFVALVEQDPALAFGILRLANSALFRTGNEIASVEQSVLKLGFRQCRNLLVAISVRSLFRGLCAASRDYCKDLWHEAILAGSLARHLNLSLRLGFHGEELTAGLCHDLGRILLAIAVPQTYALLNSFEIAEGPEILLREQEYLGTDHCSLGAWYAAHNSLPQAIVNTIAFHHTPEKATADAKLNALVAVADRMVQFLNRGNNIEDYDPTNSKFWSVLLQHCPSAPAPETAPHFTRSLMIEAGRDDTLAAAFAA